MQPTTNVLNRIRENSKKNPNEIFTRLYRYMLRPDIYYVAYQNLYSNQGASTQGVNGDTADGFSSEKIQRIIQALADGTYTPHPARRTYIQKKNGKLRPLGIPTFTDKLVQEVLRMILESVYEPIFLDCSHGFRPNRSCHTALQSIKREFRGASWFIEGDIKGCFDNIEHHVLVDVIGEKIKDARLIQLIYKFLKAGYMEDWEYHTTYSGTPQGGIVSPLFANIYLHELDKHVMKTAEEFYSPRKQVCTTEYNRIQKKRSKIKAAMDTANEEERAALLAEEKRLRAQLVQTPCRSQTDKKMKYVRYADDFLISVNGSKADCEMLKKKLSDFISGALKMKLSDEKTLITHSNTHARFLGYDVRVRRSNKLKKNKVRGTMRTLNGSVELNIPLDDKIMRFLFDKKIIEQKNGKIEPRERRAMLRCTEFEIVSTYNAELRGICNYYSLASNFYKLNYFAYLMEYSCLKTIAAKRKTTVRQLWQKILKDGRGKWCVPYTTKDGEKHIYFADYRNCKRTKQFEDTIEKMAVITCYGRTTFESRLAAKQCELCGTTEAEHYEVHHVNKIRNLSGKETWEQIMIAKNRKTMVLCSDCHHKIHHQ